MLRRSGILFLTLLSVLLTASYPVREGTEVTAMGGGGVYESRREYTGCTGQSAAWKIQSAHQEGGLALKHRFEDTRLYIAAESISGRLQDVNVYEYYSTDEAIEPKTHDEMYIGRHSVRFGFQESLFGLEAGPAFAYFELDGDVILLPAPSAAVRIGQVQGWFIYADFLTESMYTRDFGRAGFGYNGDKMRAKLSIDRSADFDVRLGEHAWIGARGALLGGGRFGPQWSAAGKLTLAFYPPPPTRPTSR